MASIVGGFLLPHNPGIYMVPKERWRPGTRDRIFSWFEEVSQRVRDLDVDTVVMIGDDHYTLFGPHCIPRCLIGIGDVDGPQEEWLGFHHAPIANNEPLARHILDGGHAEGIDWAFAKALTVDHAISIPHELVLRQNAKVRTIPVYINSGVQPVISSRRAHEVGQSIRRAIESWSGDERVVVFGTGGMSHWVGSEGMGQVNETFDRMLLSLIEAGDVESMIALSDAEVETDAGDGALEIKNFICAMGVFPSAKARTIGYEAMPELITGLGFAELAA